MSTPLEPPLKRFIDGDPLNYERALMVELIHNSQAFKSLRAKLCPWDDTLQNHRADFVTPRYNTLYAALFFYWKILGTTVTAQKADQGFLENILIDWANRGKISKEEAEALIEEMKLDFFKPNPRPAEAISQAVVGPMCQYWLDVRLTRRMADRVANEARNTILTPDVLKLRVQELERQRMQTLSSVEMAAPMINGKIRICGKVRTCFRGLNAALGGGFGYGNASLIAGVNASGKTVLSTQLALDFAHRNRKVVYVTTEQPPFELVSRMASNVLQINYSHFTNRKDVVADTTQDREVPMIPQQVQDDPRNADKLKSLEQRLQSICFIDWSQGQGLSIATNLESELEALESYNFIPDVLILDWIGGGLAKGPGGKNELRHLYQQAADWGVDYAKRNRKIVIGMAQFDRTKAMGKHQCGSAMLSECKTMVNNMTNFVGISAVLETGRTEMGVFARNQWFYVEKARDGLTGCVPVERHFHYQRFQDKGAQLREANYA